MIAAVYTQGGSRLMKCKGRVASLAAVTLLIVATEAHAECAWLLWNTYMTTRSDNVKTEQAVERAFESRRDCEQAIPEHVRSHVKTWGDFYERVSLLDPAMVFAKGRRQAAPNSTAQEDTLVVRVSCWPLGLQPKSVGGGAEYPGGDSR